MIDPYDQGDDLDLPDTRARMVAGFVIIALAMVGLAFLLAAIIRALG